MIYVQHGGDIYENEVEYDFSVNVNPLGMPKMARNALMDAVDQTVSYPDLYSRDLVQEINKKISKEYNLDLSNPFSQVILGNGASEIFMAVARAIKPDKILIPCPSFFGYQHVAKAMGCQVEFFQLKEELGYGFHGEILEKMNQNVDMMFIANPNNPTGSMINENLLKKILARAFEKKIYIVLDECFIEFVKEGKSLMKELYKYPYLIIVRAFTKIYGMPGVRLGYCVVSDEKLGGKIKCQLPEWNVSVFAQEAGVASLRDEFFIEKTKEYVAAERGFLVNGIERIRKKYSPVLQDESDNDVKSGIDFLKNLDIRTIEGVANFIMLKTEIPLYELMLEKKILIRKCDNYIGIGEGYYRIAVRTHKENEHFLEVLERIIDEEKR